MITFTSMGAPSPKPKIIDVTGIIRECVAIRWKQEDNRAIIVLSWYKLEHLLKAAVPYYPLSGATIIITEDNRVIYVLELPGILKN